MAMVVVDVVVPTAGAARHNNIDAPAVDPSSAAEERRQKFQALRAALKTGKTVRIAAPEAFWRFVEPQVIPNGPERLVVTAGTWGRLSAALDPDTNEADRFTSTIEILEAAAPASVRESMAADRRGQVVPELIPDITGNVTVSLTAARDERRAASQLLTPSEWKDACAECAVDADGKPGWRLVAWLASRLATNNEQG